MKRREFLKTTVLAAGAIGLFGCANGRDEDSSSFGGREVKPGEKYFPQSVASGDPKQASVILWTRVVDPGAEGDFSLTLEVALDQEFKMRVDLPKAAASLQAKAEHNGCVRVRVESLEPSTTYYYRFAYLIAGTAYVSRTGRTKTAAASDADTSVTFAVVSCQDYVGRHYHAFEHMAAQELDFFVHLGDYVYETTGDPEFQNTAGERKVTFTDTEGAIALEADTITFYAASSLGNYRELYQTYRSDPKLQRVHELFPMIAVWDDHEFSDDSHGQTATYSNGEKDEHDPTRRANADQAWFEFMPMDYREPSFVYDREAAAFPEDITIYRDFTFGKHVHLVMTDLRRYRDDHIVPEDAFPGAVAASQEELMAALGVLPDFATAYVDLDAAEYSAQKRALNTEARALGFLEGDFAGLVAVAFVNEQIKKLSASPKPDAIDANGKPRGISFADMFKTNRFSNVGSRYVVRTQPYEAYARVLWYKSGGDAQQIMGAEQESWFFNTIKDSQQTWKVWGNEFTFMPRRVDLRNQPLAAAVGLQALLSLSAEDWDGVPDRRLKILETIGSVPNLVAVTGDIHAFFAGIARHPDDKQKAIVEFVAGAVSSATYFDLVKAVALSVNPLAGVLAESAEELLTAGNPHLAKVALKQNGYGVFMASAESLDVKYYAIDAQKITQEDVSGAIADAFVETDFKVAVGKKELLRTHQGGSERWDPDAGKWVSA